MLPHSEKYTLGIWYHPGDRLRRKLSAETGVSGKSSFNTNRAEHTNPVQACKDIQAERTGAPGQDSCRNVCEREKRLAGGPYCSGGGGAMRCALLEACGLQMAKVPLRARCDVAAFLLALFTCPTVVVIRIEHLLPRAGRH